MTQAIPDAPQDYTQGDETKARAWTRGYEAALAAVLQKVRERLLDGLSEHSPAGRVIVGAFDHAFPQDESIAPCPRCGRVSCAEEREIRLSDSSFDEDESEGEEFREPSEDLYRETHEDKP